jgi:hypothetical protein
MRRDGGTLITVAAGLASASLVLLTALRVADEPPAAMRGAAAAARVVGGLESTFDGTKYRIAGTVRDHFDRVHVLLFTVEEEEFRRAREEYGFDRRELPGFLEGSLLGYVRDESARRSLEVTATVAATSDGSVDLHFRYRTRSDAERAAVKRLMEDASTKVDELRDAWYHRCGFVVEGDTVRPDYQWLKDRNAPRLADLRARLASVGGDGDRLSLTLAFCQQIPYTVEPMDPDGRFTSGVLPPTQVVVEQHGDCDCKAVLFATLWAGPPRGEVILVDVPGHVFAAVRGQPRFATDTAFTLDGQSYLCVEPVGPGIVPAGQVAASSRQHLRAGNYRLIPVA